MLAPEAEFLFNPNWPPNNNPVSNTPTVTHQQLRSWVSKGSMWFFILTLWKVASIIRIIYG